MATNKFLKVFICFDNCYNFIWFCVQESSAYPVFAQQNYSNPRAWKTSLCKLSFKSKAIEVEAPQAVLPNSVFEAIKVPYDVNKQQIGLMEKS
jgi:hypothetical protein